MRFKAQYKSLYTKADGNSYWRQVDADNESEANKLAMRMARKGYRLVLLTQDLGKE